MTEASWNKFVIQSRIKQDLGIDCESDISLHVTANALIVPLIDSLERADKSNAARHHRGASRRSEKRLRPASESKNDD